MPADIKYNHKEAFILVEWQLAEYWGLCKRDVAGILILLSWEGQKSS